MDTPDTCVGVAIREFPLASGHGFADYMLWIEGKAAETIDDVRTALEQFEVIRADL
jgi:hypothetical protein